MNKYLDILGQDYKPTKNSFLYKIQKYFYNSKQKAKKQTKNLQTFWLASFL